MLGRSFLDTYKGLAEQYRITLPVNRRQRRTAKQQQFKNHVSEAYSPQE